MPSVRAIPFGSKIEYLPDPTSLPQPHPRPLLDILRTVDLLRATGDQIQFDLYWDYLLLVRAAA